MIIHLGDKEYKVEPTFDNFPMSPESLIKSINAGVAQAMLMFVDDMARGSKEIELLSKCDDVRKSIRSFK